MERHFDEELANLNEKLRKMGLLTQEAIAKSIEALRERDPDMAKDVIQSDQAIDFLENEIDEDVCDMVARHQPVASDLRLLLMTLKVNTDIERIADLAVDISERIVEMNREPLLKPLIDIPKLSRVAQDMVAHAVDAFVKRDIALARRVGALETEADDLRDRIQNELINDFMAKDPTSARRAVPLLLIARYLERMCDHATNIAEDIIYIVEAKVVKHHHEDMGASG